MTHDVEEILQEVKKNGRTFLDLSGKGLKNIPHQLFEITHLEGLDLSKNEIQVVPNEIRKLKCLKQLNLNSNQLSTLPETLGQLTNLEELKLNFNYLSTLPETLGQLTNLKELDLNSNQLSTLPETLGQLTNLKELYLTSNQLSTLPETLGQLTNLKELYLNSNQLSTLPETLGQLTNLKELYLNSNQLSTLPETLGQLANLEELCLYSNQLSTLPETLGQLTNLVELDLASNHLSALPETLSQLTNLEALYLKSNKLSQIPYEIGKLSKLNFLEIDDSPSLESPPPSVVAQGTEVILAYLRNLAAGGKKRYEAKLILLGDGNKGKTCVSRALRNEEFIKGLKSTRGVDIDPWYFSHPDDPDNPEKNITLKIWDFEGQEINHQTHQFFLSQKALYILVFNGREEFDEKRMVYWLDNIQARIGSARVTLVATQCEKATPMVPYDKIQAEYPSLLPREREKGVFLVGCEDRKGIPELQEYLKWLSSDLLQNGLPWPTSYDESESKIEDRLEDKNHVTLSEFHELLENGGIEKADYSVITRVFDALGVITYFPDCPELQDFIVLSPSWLTKAISATMEDQALSENQGEISVKRLFRIWEKHGECRFALLQCMKEFELCYQLDYHADGLILVPLRFKYVGPDQFPWTQHPDLKKRVVEYRFDKRPPDGLMARFIVKVHPYIVKTDEFKKGIYWRNGVFIHIPETHRDDPSWTAEALCEYDDDDRTLSFTVQAAFPQRTLGQLQTYLEDVLRFYPGLKPEKFYGCIKVDEDSDLETQCDNRHDEEQVTFQLAEKAPIYCGKGRHKIDPLRLIYGFTNFGKGMPPEQRKELRAMLDEEPEWAKYFGQDIQTVLKRSSVLIDLMENVSGGLESIPAKTAQECLLFMDDYLLAFDRMLDDRDLASAPAILSIAPVNGSRFNPTNWFREKYVLTPYCECPDRIHPCEDGRVPFSMPRDWWRTTAPKLSLAFKTLSTGLKIAGVFFPMIDPKAYDQMKYQVEFMKELTAQLSVVKSGGSDIAGMERELRRSHSADRFEDVYDSGRKGRDQQEETRWQLVELLQAIAPENYQERRWGSLERVRQRNGTYRWLCPAHRKSRSESC